MGRRSDAASVRQTQAAAARGFETASKEHPIGSPLDKGFFDEIVVHLLRLNLGIADAQSSLYMSDRTIGRP
jgi:hypothetical protein